MSDLISREDAIETIRKLPNAGIHWFVSAEAVFDALLKLPSAQSEQRWIPCSEGMPKEDGTYIVSGVWDSGKKQVGECEFYVHDGYFRTSWNFDVKAWKSMPEPYKGE